MKLIEIVVLLGAQCISPVQHSAANTEVQKVQCAVVIEQDTSAGTVRIVPAGASTRPEVVAVLDRIGSEQAERIAPAGAPPPDPSAIAGAPPQRAAAAIAPPPEQLAAAEAKPVVDAATPAEAPAQEEPAAQETAAEPAAKPEKAKDKEKETAEAPAPGIVTKCKGKAEARWYTNDEGRKKYRCVLPG
jgi:hypothetical protein